MQYRQYGQEGPRVSALGFGVMRLPHRKKGDWDSVNFSRAVPLLRQALEAGVNFLDSHHRYHGGLSEVAIGRALRGWKGQRVYTHNVIFRREDFPGCRYNPFNVLRAMVAAGLDMPQLKPPAVLPDIELEVTTALPAKWHLPIDSTWRGHLLEGLLDGRSFVVNLDDGWRESAEALLMGVPGPERADLSFDAGFKFSIGRNHNLHLLQDDAGLARARTAGQPIEYIDPQGAVPTGSTKNAWGSFVDRHWATGDIAGLARRTSREFTDVSPAGRERLGRLYGLIDNVGGIETAALLTAAGGHLEAVDQHGPRRVVYRKYLGADVLFTVGDQHFVALFIVFAERAAGGNAILLVTKEVFHA